jgi:azurin
MMADADPRASWQTAAARDGHLRALLRAVPSVPFVTETDGLRGQLFTSIVALLRGAPDAGTRADAFDALGWTRLDTATFDLVAGEILNPADPESRAAAIRSLQRIPESAWSAATLEPLASAIVKLVADTPPSRRTDAASVEALQIGERLAAALPEGRGRAIRSDLRALGVQVVRIDTIPEQMRFKLNWFVVEAGKQVQIILGNPDAMPHNLVVGRPGSLEEIGTTGGAMPMPTDAAAKPFVPDSPLVVAATRLVQGGETERLSFTAPQAPGEYIYVCTFPGHWVRMYGVMLVVENLETWEAKPTVPIDPVTKTRFAAREN